MNHRVKVVLSYVILSLFYLQCIVIVCDINSHALFTYKFCLEKFRLSDSRAGSCTALCSNTYLIIIVQIQFYNFLSLVSSKQSIFNLTILNCHFKIFYKFNLQSGDYLDICNTVFFYVYQNDCDSFEKQLHSFKVKR